LVWKFRCGTKRGSRDWEIDESPFAVAFPLKMILIVEASVSENKSGRDANDNNSFCCFHVYEYGLKIAGSRKKLFLISFVLALCSGRGGGGQREKVGGHVEASRGPSV
jgi:hypothetical protein